MADLFDEIQEVQGKNKAKQARASGGDLFDEIAAMSPDLAEQPQNKGGAQLAQGGIRCPALSRLLSRIRAWQAARRKRRP